LTGKKVCDKIEKKQERKDERNNSEMTGLRQRKYSKIWVWKKGTRKI
jgi:hypothetical protein